MYYQNFEHVIFVHAMYLFLIISMRELTKDLENIPGDLAQDYKTIPIVYGEKYSKIMLTVLVLLTLVPTYFLLTKYKIGHMYYFFYFMMFLLAMFLVLLWNSSSKKHYLILHNILKFIIFSGVFSVLLIDTDLVLNRLF